MLQCHPLYPPGSTLPWKAELCWHWRISSSGIFLEGTKQVLTSAQNKADRQRLQWRTCRSSPLFLSCPSTATGKEGTSEHKAAHKEPLLPFLRVRLPHPAQILPHRSHQKPRQVWPLFWAWGHKSQRSCSRSQADFSKLLSQEISSLPSFLVEHPAKPIDTGFRTSSLMWLFAQEETMLWALQPFR